MALKILGVGMSRTGTTSLANALTMLGYNTLHWCPERLRDAMMLGTSRNWRRYDDVDAVTDLPAALFYRELLQAYPKAKCILTVRDVDEWFQSVRWLFDKNIAKRFHGTLLQEARVTQAYAYGSVPLNPILARKRYEDHNRLVQLHIPADRLLILDVQSGWEPLCAFLGKPVPTVPFPHANRRKS